MTNKRKIGMHRLNPTHKVDNEVFMGFFPPNLDYYNDLLQDEGFKLFLMSDGTTKEGQDRIADYFPSPPVGHEDTIITSFDIPCSL